MAAIPESSTAVVRLARAVGLLAALAVCGCTSGPGSPSHAELARQRAEFEARVNAIVPACTTMVRPNGIMEYCRFVEDGKLRCVRTHMSQADGEVGELLCWYKDDRPWATRSWSRRSAPTADEPWKESSLDAYYDQSGHVLWAESGVDGLRRTISDRGQLEWLERNTYKQMQTDVDLDLMRVSGR